MEVGLEPGIPTYSGGLGVLAGDTLRAAADFGIPMVGVTLLYRKGYFRQHLDEAGNQTESPVEWSPEHRLEPVTQRAIVHIEGRPVRIRAWRYTIQGVEGHEVPVFFLDTSCEDNRESDKEITDYLYGGDQYLRLRQEAVLGLGGIAMLRTLGYTKLQAYHMNEGHSALLTCALLDEIIGSRDLSTVTQSDIEAVRRECVFTTHTPVPAGHDQFDRDLVVRIAGEDYVGAMQKAGCFLNGTLNMTHMGLVFSRYINGVSMRHEEISRGLFPTYPINSVTNGVHAVTWASGPFQDLYDRYVPEWRRDNLYLRYAISIPLEKIQEAHAKAKRALLTRVERKTRMKLDPDVMTIGFARRATGYKRADLLFSDVNRIKKIAKQAGPFQIVYAGKAHPNDESGKDLIRRVFKAAAALRDEVRVVYLEDYGIALAKYIISGVDLWLNTPLKPHEASGTSGMKAAVNGVPSMSVLDGWWIEGHVEGVTGWSIGSTEKSNSAPAEVAESLYHKLEHVLLPLYYNHPEDFAAIMRSAVALNGSYYNAGRMVLQYLVNAYYP
jgi:starch phosphorylase